MGSAGTRKAPVRPYAGVSAAERVASRRARFLDAGLELFGTRGVQATHVKDICAEAGLTDRYFYESFGDSAALLTAVFDRVGAELFASIASATATAPTEPEAQVRAAVSTFVGELAADPRKARILFTEATAAGGPVGEHMRKTLRGFAGLVGETARPYLPDDVPEHVIKMGTLSLAGAIERVIVEWHDGTLSVSVEQLTEHCIALLMTAGASFGVA